MALIDPACGLPAGSFAPRAGAVWPLKTLMARPLRPTAASLLEREWPRLKRPGSATPARRRPRPPNITPQANIFSHGWHYGWYRGKYDRYAWHGDRYNAWDPVAAAAMGLATLPLALVTGSWPYYNYPYYGYPYYY
jgi:hypothetical protein